MEQNYNAYTIEDQQTWQLLFDKQKGNMAYASQAYIDGVDLIGFNRDEIPRFSEMNEVLNNATGWMVEVVPGWIPENTFFTLLFNRKFPSSTWLRSQDQLEYLEEPDMFHDVFGHVPLLTNQAFVDFLFELSKLGLDYIDNEYALDLLSRVYWYTVEFGLIRENNELKIYGAGILSSSGETIYSVSDKPEHFEFSVPEIISLPFRKDVFQTRYFIINSYDQLYDSVAEIKTEIEKRCKPVHQ